MPGGAPPVAQQERAPAGGGADGSTEAVVPRSDPVPGEGAQEVPIPLPNQREPTYAGEVHVELVLPVADSPLCPAGARCIFGGGAGVGGLIERRWIRGFALGLVYDLWLLDGNGVYEVSVMNALAATVRQFFLLDRMVHPFLGGSIGGLLFGDSFGVDAVGAHAEAIGGVEIEMSTSLALTVSTVWRLFITSSFTSANDGVKRVQDQGLNLAATLRLGLTILP